MTFEEAKKRNDYRFNSDFATSYLPDLIKSMQMGENEEYFIETYRDNPQFGIAQMELGYIDIELNLTEYGAEYFICTKDKAGDWDSAGYVPDLMMEIGLSGASYDWVVDADFDSTEWEHELECDMFRVLKNVIRSTEWSVTSPNESYCRRRVV